MGKQEIPSCMQEYNEFPLNFIKLHDMIMQFANKSFVL